MAYTREQFLLGSIAVFHEPSRAYVEPWTGDWFGEGGVEQDPHVYPASAAAGVHGEVIMEKLGNATAKYASSVSILHCTDNSRLIELSWAGLPGNFCKSGQHLTSDGETDFLRL